MKSTRILFIGNSYTHFNELPAMFAELATAAGNPVEVERVTKGGMSLAWHWYNNETLDALTGARWDYVVLQDQSTRPADDPAGTRRDVARFATKIRAAGATPVLYLTWARRHIPEMQAALTATYEAAAADVDALIAPVGPAWAKAMADDPDLVLHVADRSHPNILGSYLAACVFYATLFGESPKRLPNQYTLSPGVTATIDQPQSRFLQETAWSISRETTSPLS